MTIFRKIILKRKHITSFIYSNYVSMTTQKYVHISEFWVRFWVYPLTEYISYVNFTVCHSLKRELIENNHVHLIHELGLLSYLVTQEDTSNRKNPRASQLKVKFDNPPW